jgi:hypothetical protein
MSRLSTAEVQVFAEDPECEICGGTRFRVRVCPVHVGEYYEITARCRFCGHSNAITREAARALRIASESP